jgi:hypothetical protein
VQCTECGTHFLYAGAPAAPEAAEEVEQEDEDTQEEQPQEWEIESLLPSTARTAPAPLVHLHLLGTLFQRWNVAFYARANKLWPEPAGRLLSWLVPAGVGALVALGLRLFLPAAAAWPCALIVGGLSLAYAVLIGRAFVFARRKPSVRQVMGRLDARMADLRTALQRAKSVKSARRRALRGRGGRLLGRLLAAPIVLKVGVCAVVALLVVGAALLAMHLARERPEPQPAPAPQHIAATPPVTPEEAPTASPLVIASSEVEVEPEEPPPEAPLPDTPGLSGGMTPAEARALLGEPDGESRIVRADQAHLWWRYEDGLELRFVNGELRDWERTAVAVAGPGNEPEPAQDEEAVAYLDRITVRDVRVIESVFGDRGVAGEILNEGSRPLADVQLTVTCFDAAGAPVSRECVHAFGRPVEASCRSAGDILAPGCARSFRVKLTDAPAGWDGRAVVNVDKVAFSE